MSQSSKSDKVMITEVMQMMGVARSTAMYRLEEAGIRKFLGRHPQTKRPIVLYPRADVEKLIAEGFRPPGRPSTRKQD